MLWEDVKKGGMYLKSSEKYLHNLKRQVQADIHHLITTSYFELKNKIFLGFKSIISE
jgi:hypothetical protein